MNYAALLKRQFLVDSLALRQGRLAWPVVSTNSTPRQLSVEHIQTDLQLLTNDVWELDNLQAEFAGAKIQLTGALTNASALRDWKWFQATQPAPHGTLQNRLRGIADTLQEIHFARQPDLKLISAETRAAWIVSRCVCSSALRPPTRHGAPPTG